MKIYQKSFKKEKLRSPNPVIISRVIFLIKKHLKWMESLKIKNERIY